MTGQDSTHTRRLGLTLLAVSVLGAGCTAVLANLVLGRHTNVSLRLKGDDAILRSLAADLGSEFGVSTAIQAVETGAMVVNLVGTAVEIVEAVRWIADLGLEIVANDAATATLFQTAMFAFLK